jgi:serine phosphatase RsbU (regulator of sigma subunit)
LPAWSNHVRSSSFRTSDGGCAKSRILTSIEENAAGGAQLLDAIVNAVRLALAGREQPDDLTLLTARVLGSGQIGAVH